MKADNFIMKAAHRRYGWNPENLWERGAFHPRQRMAFLNGLQNDMEKARWFADLAYSSGWIDDAAVNAWFMVVSKA